MKRRRFLFIRIGSFRLIIRKSVVVGLFILSLALLTLSHSDSPMVKKITGSVSSALSPVIKVAQYPAHLVYQSYEGVLDVFRVYTQNKRLKAENENVLLLKVKLNALQSENEMLKKMLNYTPPPEAHFVTAKIVAQEGDGFSHSLIVYLGDEAKVRSGEAVLGEDGVVGRVESISGSYARIILLTDINSKIPVMTEEKRIRGMLSGDNTMIPKLIFTALDADINVGDFIVTSGVAGTFPSGLPIGRVSRIYKNTIEVDLISNIEKLEYVKIIDYGIQSIIVNQTAVSEE